jgi:hypothetical protein
MKHAYELTLSLKAEEDQSVAENLDRLQRFSKALERLSSNLEEWFLAGETEEEALLYQVFKDGQPTKAAMAVLETNLARKLDPRIISIWNGKQGLAGASLRFIARPVDHPSLVTFVGRPQSFSDDWHAIAEAVAVGVDIWSPSYVSLESNGYYDVRVFKDRPGVGWMLYLPRVLTAQQVPEARALVPVMGKNAKGKDEQRGTIIVSVTDEPFSDENPDHVRIANAIEIRLVDQDLLPRYADL